MCNLRFIYRNIKMLLYVTEVEFINILILTCRVIRFTESLHTDLRKQLTEVTEETHIAL